MIEEGKTVKFHFTLRVDGDVLQSTEGEEPLAYVQGSGQLLPALEEQLETMSEGDRKEVRLPPERAYGERDPDAVRTFEKTAFDDPDAVRVGSRVRGQAGGSQFEAFVTEVGHDQITLDLNHPLAGKTLDFELEIVAVE